MYSYFSLLLLLDHAKVSNPNIPSDAARLPETFVEICIMILLPMAM